VVEQNRDSVCVGPQLGRPWEQLCRVNIVQYCAGFRGMASKAEIMLGWGVPPSKMELLQGCAGLGRLAGKAEILQGWGPQLSMMELLQGCTGLGGHGLVEIVGVCGSLALRAPPMEILWV
jgi:hypothetical protein